jgi:hypothetical protein
VETVGGAPFAFRASLGDQVFGFLGATIHRTSLDGNLVWTLSGEIQSAPNGSYQAIGEAKAVIRF